MISKVQIALLLIIGLWSCDADSGHFTSDSVINKVGTMELVWFDEFDSQILDSNKWTAIDGNGCPNICGFGNNELQYYSPENISLENGLLKIEARLENVGDNQYTSAKLVSKNKGDWMYGKIEVKAKLPQGKGTWPAIWMLPTLNRNFEWPRDGEIDIMEHVGYNQGTVYGTIHTQKFNGMLGTQKSDSLYVDDLAQNFHTYAIVWTPEAITWFIDEQSFLTLSKGSENYEGWPFDQPFHLILNLAVGGNWGGKYGVDDRIWPQKMEFDYVRIYQEKKDQKI